MKIGSNVMPSDTSHFVCPFRESTECENKENMPAPSNVKENMDDPNKLSMKEIEELARNERW